MASNWLKIEKSTARKREILIIAAELGIHPDHAFGLCFRFWAWADDNLTDSNAKGVTQNLIDTLLGHDGIAAALIKADWLRDRSGSLEIPHFDRHLSQGSKTRALATERQAKHRDRKDAESNDTSVTEASPEKRREDKNNTNKNSSGIPPDLIEQIYQAYPKKVGKPKALAAIKKALKQTPFETLLKLTQSYANSRSGQDPQFTPNPSTWFNQERYLDEPETWNTGNSQSSSGKARVNRNAGNTNSTADPSDFDFS